MKPAEDIRQKSDEEPLYAEHKRVNEEIDKGEKEHGIFSRGIAAEIFQDMADLAWAGVVPRKVSPYALGRAVSRLIYNNHLEDSYNDVELLRGLFHLSATQCASVLDTINEMREQNEKEITETRSGLKNTLK